MNAEERKKFEASVEKIVSTIHEQEDECDEAVKKRVAEIGTLYSLITYHAANEDKLDEETHANVLVSLVQTIYSLGYLDAKRKFAI